MKNKLTNLAFRCLALLLAIIIAVPPVYVHAEDPVATDPVVTEPIVTEPVVTEPPVTEPPATVPAETVPAADNSQKASRGVPLTNAGPSTKATEQVTGGVAWTLENGVLTLFPATAPAEGYESGVMPAEYKNAATADGGSPWYGKKTEITSVVVRDGVKNLSMRSFMGASNLQSVTLPNGLNTIGARCFQTCTALNSINIPDSLSTLGDYAFNACHSLQSLDLSKTTITSIGTLAFAGCKALKTLSIPSTVTTIANDAFYKQSSVSTAALETLNYGGDLVGWEKFNILGSNNTNLKNGKCTVYCANDIQWTATKTVGENWEYTRATNTLTLKYTGEMPNFEAGKTPWYVYASAIKTVAFEEGITKVGANAFLGCNTLTHNLTDAQFETLKAASNRTGNAALFGPVEEKVSGGIKWEVADGVLTIAAATTPAEGSEKGKMPDYTEGNTPWNAEISNITKVVIAEDVTRIGANAFAGFAEGVTYTYNGNLDTLKGNSSTTGNEGLFGEDTVDENIITGTTGDVTYTLNKTTGVMTLSGSGATATYTEASDLTNDKDWADLLPLVAELVVQEGVTSLGNRLFTKSLTLKKVTLPASLESIGYRCFTDCYALEEVVFSATGQLSLNSLGKECAFNGCTSLKTIDLSRTQITTLTRKAFAACSSLETIYLPATVTTIADECFGKTKLNGSSSYTKTNNLKNLYYSGSLANWENIKILDTTDNTQLTNGNCTVYCADNIQWTATKTVGENWEYTRATNTLTLKYTGEMPSFEAGKAPWYVYASAIKTVAFEEGISKVGANAFYGCANLTHNLTDAQFDTLKAASNRIGNDALFGPVEEKVSGGIKWEVADGVLTIAAATTPAEGSEKGKMPDYTEGNTPWNAEISNITKVVIAEDVTRIGANAFKSFGEGVTYTYNGNLDTLKQNSSTTGNEGLFGVEEDPNYVTGGVVWKLENGVLTIAPAVNPETGYAKGQMRTDYTSPTAKENKFPVPWADQMGTITKLVVKSGVTNLAPRVCTDAEMLTSVTLPDGLTAIGARCFSECISLTSITIPSSVSELGEVAFNGCTGLTTIDLRHTQIKQLPRKAFAACSALESIYLPVLVNTTVNSKTVYGIGESAFGRTKLDDVNFTYTNKLTALYFDGTLEAWNNGALINSTENYTLNNGSCTVYCTDGIWVKGYTSAGTNMCYKLADGTLTIRCNGATPDYTTESPAPWATSASTITKVVFEGDITKVGTNAFLGCNTLTHNLTDTQFEALKEASDPTGNDALFGSNEPTPVPEPNTTGGVLWVLEDGVLTLSPATVPESTAYAVGQMPELYGNDLATGAPWFKDMETITSVIVKDGITNLGGRAFTGAKKLKTISLPDTLTAIGQRCFQSCEVLEAITVPSNVSNLGAYAFVACKSLKVVDLSRNTGITEIGAKTFAGCRDLTTLYLPGSVGKLANNVFTDNSGSDTANLTKLYYGGTLAAWKNITNHAASSNVNLYNGKCTVICTDGVWANGFESSGANMCYKIDNGTLLIRCFGDMDDYAAGAAPWFEKASAVTTIVFEDGITAIGDNAFDGFVNLTDVTLPKDLTKVGENAFADCENLVNVLFYGTPAQWTALQQASESGNGPLFRIAITSGYNGDCGDNATWEYDPDTKTLTISGTGPMWDWNQRTYKNTPWSRYKDEIEKIKIDYGITNTGRYAFCYMNALKELELVTNEAGFTTVETIGGYCFCWESQLTTLKLPEGVRFLAGRAFSSVEMLQTVYFPSTLESIDMYAFDSKDDVIINKVIYNGTKEDWERKVYVSTQGDGLDQLFNKNTEWVYLKEYSYYDDVSDQSWYADSIYYLKDQGMAPENGTFGANDAAVMQWVLDALYIRSGSSGAYTDSLDWAKAKSIVTAETKTTDAMTLDALANILYRTTLYNGNVASLGEGTALAWCKDYIPAELANTAADKALTRAETASVLAAYLQSDNGKANRYDEMREDMKSAYETSGGDGKMHILALQHRGTGKFGDCTLILLPGGETMLIDTFRNDGWQNYLKATLDSLGVKKLDYLVLSHGHEDHDANLTDVIDYIYKNGYTVGNYWSAGSTTSTRETAAINLLKEKGGVNIQNRLRAGQKLTIGSGSNTVTVEILWPMEEGKGYTSGESNDGSLTMKLIYGNSSYLCGGDLFLTAEEDILDMYKDDPDALKADVMKTNHHGSYSSNGSNWVAAVDPMAMITFSDDTGDSSQCYEYSQDGRAWFSAGRDGGVLVTMDSEKNISVTTGFDSNLRQDIVACGMKGHTFQNRKWQFDENGHWRKCSGYWLCGVLETVQAHTGGTATCKNGKICDTCGYEYTEAGDHHWIYSANGHVLTATCETCQTSGGTLTLICPSAVYDGTEKVVRVSGTIDGVTVPAVVYDGSRTNAGSSFTASIQLGDAKAELIVAITKRDVTVTAGDQAIAHGSKISGTAFTSEGLANGHTLTVSLTPSTNDPTTNGTITPSNAVITSGSNVVTPNYNITYVNGKLVIENPAADAVAKADAVEEAISKLPATVEPDDEAEAEKILAAKKAYDDLSAYEKTLVDSASAKKLNDLVASLTDYDIIKGDGSKWTKGSDGSLTFTANGPYSKFTGIEINGYGVAKQYYDAKSGSTIITLKASYLKSLASGNHTITVLYTDGETSASFTVQPKATTPATSDDSLIVLWISLMLISMIAMAAMTVYHKMFAYKGKYVRK